MPTQDISCFVIMPFSQTVGEHTEEYWTQHFDSFLKPIIEEVQNMKAIRSEALRVDILRQIITDLAFSPIVVADLTDHNPNVFWELGVRQSFKHRTITIAENGTRLPFDLSVKGTLFYYPKDHIRNERFKRQFKKALEDCISHPEVPDSPVLETITGRGSIFEIIRRDEALRRVKALISECDRNLRVMDHIIKTCKKNEKARKKGKPEDVLYVTSRLRSSAIELLMTNRYLDENDSFYDEIGKRFDEFIRVNDQLSSQRTAEQSVEDWCTTYMEEYKRSLTKYKLTLQGILGKLFALGKPNQE